MSPVFWPSGKPNPKAENVGLQCRKCGCRHFVVARTVPLKNGSIRRYRYCRNCGKAMHTTERPDEE